ncbi:MAG: hypothetical protein KGK11_00420 [Sphingomonadales bacterium]|nr:hypothetical protein [Sphingomonadales bacterium]
MTQQAARAHPLLRKRGAAPGWLVAIWLLTPPVLLALSLTRPGDDVPYLLMVRQNRELIVAFLALAALTVLPLGPRVARLRLSNRGLGGIALALALAAWAGHHALLAGYDLSRDEQMASFDAAIYGAGRLAWPLPALWQRQTAPLNMLFMLPIDRPVAWVSAYLPGNAMLRALFARLGDAALTGAALNAASMLLLWGCAKRIWPGADERSAEPRVVAVLLLALSPQFVVTGMTAFAMSAHLACNLLWLWLFLRDSRAGDGAAIAVGAFATGLHQPLFHPLFVAPFLVLLWHERRWRRLALFTAAYAAIAGFWLAWPEVTRMLVSGPHSALASNAGGAGYGARLRDALASNHDNVAIMAANLLHFIVWQHVLLLPLLAAGVLAARRAPLAAALAAGFAAPVVAMTLLMPPQGHGMGYRYLHGVLGNAALLGGYGWCWLAPFHARLRPLLLRASLATALVLLPLDGWLTHALYAAYARTDARIAASGADYIVLGEDDVPLALDLVLNRPDLSNRPLRLDADQIDDADALGAAICGKRAVMALPADSFYADVLRWSRLPPRGHADARLAEFGAAFGAAGCKVRVLR